MLENKNAQNVIWQVLSDHNVIGLALISELLTIIEQTSDQKPIL